MRMLRLVPAIYEIPINFGPFAVSKTYAPGATCAPEKTRRLRFDPAQHRPSKCCEDCCFDAGHLRSTPMLDVLMLALALGFFAAAIGYTYACERL